MESRRNQGTIGKVTNNQTMLNLQTKSNKLFKLCFKNARQLMSAKPVFSFFAGGGGGEGEGRKKIKKKYNPFF